MKFYFVIIDVIRLVIACLYFVLHSFYTYSGIQLHKARAVMVVIEINIVVSCYIILRI